MIEKLKKYEKLNQTILFLILGFMSYGILLFRIIYTHSIGFVFLAFNLFLAAIPWGIITFIIIFPKIQKRKILMLILSSFWLLFLPNAPYILTDLFHLNKNWTMHVWFDTFLILSFAWTGLLFGLTSLMEFEKILEKYVSKNWIGVISSLLLFVASFDVYLGRFLRWNSWDMIKYPKTIMLDVLDRFANPFSHPRTWGMTILVGVLLNMFYWSIKLLMKNRKTEQSV